MERQDNKRKVKTDVTIGIVGHCSLEEAIRVREYLTDDENFDIIFFKTTSGKLWIKEGDYDE